jgi:hypothetical protein
MSSRDTQNPVTGEHLFEALVNDRSSPYNRNPHRTHVLMK